MGRLRKNDPGTLRQLRHLSAKVNARAPELERVRRRCAEGARTLLVSFGITARACRQAVDELLAEGYRVDSLEILSLFPVPVRAVSEAVSGMDRVVIAEENESGLYAKELRPWLGAAEVRQVNALGCMVSPAAIREAVLA